jgi:hypothetical protein
MECSSRFLLAAHFIDESHSDTRRFPPIKRLLQAERNTRMEAVCPHGYSLFKINCVQFVIDDYRHLRKQKNIKRYNRGKLCPNKKILSMENHPL